MLQVRSRAQVKLFTALDQFSYSYTVLIPHLLGHLQQDCSLFHEQFKVRQSVTYCCYMGVGMASELLNSCVREREREYVATWV
jgi:hypothetical protein